MANFKNTNDIWGALKDVQRSNKSIIKVRATQALGDIANEEIFFLEITTNNDSTLSYRAITSSGATNEVPTWEGFSTASGGSGAGINPDHVFNGLNRAEAETARDAYFVANPDELIPGTEIFLIFGDPEEAIKQVRDADSWVDQNNVLTASGVKALYESNTNTNAFTDAEQTKLSGIESGATGDLTASEIKTLYESNADTNAFTDADQTKLDGLEGNAFTNADQLKLDGIETGATADQTDAEIKTAYENNANTNALTDSNLSKINSVEDYADFGLLVGEPNGIVVLSQTGTINAINQYQIALDGHTSFRFSISNDNSLLSGVHMIAIYNGPGQAGEDELIEFVEVETLNFNQQSGFRIVTVTGGFYTLNQTDTTARTGNLVASPTISISLHKRKNFVSGSQPDWNAINPINGSFIRNKPVTITEAQIEAIQRNTANYIIERTNETKQFTVSSSLTANDQIMQPTDANPASVMFRQSLFDSFIPEEGQAVVFSEGTGRPNPGRILGYGVIRDVSTELPNDLFITLTGNYFNEDEQTPTDFAPFVFGIVGQNVVLELFTIDSFLEIPAPNYTETNPESVDFIRNKPTTISPTQSAAITANTSKLFNIDDFATETFSTEDIELQRNLSIVTNNPTAINQIGVQAGDFTEIVISTNDSDLQVIQRSDFLTLHEGPDETNPGDELVFGIIDSIATQVVGDVFDPDYILVTITGRFDRGFNHSLSPLDMVRFGAAGQETTLRTYRQKNHSVILRSNWNQTNSRHPAFIQNKPTTISTSQATAITANTTKLSGIEDNATQSFTTEAINFSRTLNITSPLSSANQILFVTGDFTQVQFTLTSTESLNATEADFLTFHAGTGQTSEGAELIFGRIDSITTEPVGSDPLDPDYVLFTVVGDFSRGFSHEEIDEFNPLSFGSVGQSTELRMYLEKNHTVNLRSDWNEQNPFHPAYIQNQPFTVTTISSATTVSTKSRYYRVNQSGGTFTLTIANPTDFDDLNNNSGQIIVHNNGDDWLRVETHLSSVNFKGTGTNFFYLLPQETRVFNIVRTTPEDYVEPIGPISYKFDVAGADTSGLVNNWVLGISSGNGIPTGLFELPSVNPERLVYKAAGAVRLVLAIRFQWPGATSTVSVRNGAGDGAINIFDGSFDNVFVTISKSGTSTFITGISSLLELNGYLVDYTPTMDLEPLAANDYLTFTGTNLISASSRIAVITVKSEYILKES